MKEKYIRNNQPHIQPVGATYSVTLLAYDAVPAAKIEEARSIRDQKLKELQDHGHSGNASLVFRCHDRYIRSMRHFHDEQNYIVNNPVKAGIVKNWNDYPYTYLSA